jgi:hypothetical protein
VRAEALRGGREDVAVGGGQVVLEVLLRERGEVRAGVRAEEREGVGGHGRVREVDGKRWDEGEVRVGHRAQRARPDPG